MPHLFWPPNGTWFLSSNGTWLSNDCHDPSFSCWSMSPGASCSNCGEVLISLPTIGPKQWRLPIGWDGCIYIYTHLYFDGIKVCKYTIFPWILCIIRWSNLIFNMFQLSGSTTRYPKDLGMKDISLNYYSGAFFRPSILFYPWSQLLAWLVEHARFITAIQGEFDPKIWARKNPGDRWLRWFFFLVVEYWCPYLMYTPSLKLTVRT